MQQISERNPYPKLLYRWQVKLDNGKDAPRICWVTAADDATARLKAAHELGVSFTQNAKFMVVQRYGRVKP